APLSVGAAMTASALTRPGERERLSVKLSQFDWRLIILATIVAGVGALMLFSGGMQSWQAWAATHLIRVGVSAALMLVLALVSLRWWYRLSYPLYFLALFLLVCVELFGYTAMGATRWLDIGVTRIQPSEIMKIGVVLALARW